MVIIKEISCDNKWDYNYYNGTYNFFYDNKYVWSYFEKNKKDEILIDDKDFLYLNNIEIVNKNNISKSNSIFIVVIIIFIIINYY